MIIWRFIPKSGKEAEFESYYVAGGAWDLLFRDGQGFVGTELLRPTGDDAAYMTIDRWRSAQDFAAFLRDYDEAYAALDAYCESLTSDEVRVGIFDVVTPLQE